MLKFVFSTQTSSVAKRFFSSNLYSSWCKQTFQNQILEYFEYVLKKQRTYQQFVISTKVRENIPEVKNINHKLKIIYEDVNCLSNLSYYQILKKKILIDDIDSRCLTIVNFLNYTDIFNLLNIILKVIPRKLTNFQFYHKSVKILLEAAENNLLDNHEKVQLLFLISLMKEKGVKYVKFLKEHLPKLEEVPLIEKSIIAQAFYQSSLKLKKEESRLLEKIIEEECENIVNNQLVLVSFCKAIRISGPSNELTLINLSNALDKSYQLLSFSSLVHILCLYAQALIFDENLINKTVSHLIKIIENDCQAQKLRLKDIDRLLWSISYLGFVLSSEHKEILKKYIEHRLEDYKTRENLGIFVNSILSLHMLQCWSLKVIEICFQEFVFEPVFLQNFHWRIRARLQLLISQMTIELKLNVSKVLRKQMKISYVVSENVKTVAKISSLLVHKRIIINTFVESPVRTLQIPGVTLMTKSSAYHIDVLDSSTCLKNTNIPHGLMKLKLRLLSHMKYQEILIDENIFKENPAKVQSTVQELIIKRLNQ